MTRDSERIPQRIPLGADRPGTHRSLLVHRYGDPEARPKAYLQASLHADETPALLVAHHLARLLGEAEERGEIVGQIVLVPYANPIGLDQIVNRGHSGRFELAGGGNFNRNWPDIFEPLCKRVSEALGDAAEANVATIRRAINEELAGLSACTSTCWPPTGLKARGWRPSWAAGPCCWPTIRAAALSTNASPPCGPASRRGFPSGRSRRPAWPEPSNCAARQTSPTPSRSKMPGRSIAPCSTMA
jgi:hypothetical protein